LSVFIDMFEVLFLLYSYELLLRHTFFGDSFGFFFGLESRFSFMSNMSIASYSWDCCEFCLFCKEYCFLGFWLDVFPEEY
jgi:hypothetical protein